MIAASTDTFVETQNASSVHLFTNAPVTSKGPEESVINLATVTPSLALQTSRNEVRVDPPVDLIARRAVTNDIREKFNDVFEVKKNLSICTGFDHMPFEVFSDEVNTVGCFCTEKAYKFFAALNANPYVLDIIRSGHHPVLSQEVKSYEFKNNGSYRKYIDFALPEILKLIKTGRVEVVKDKPEFINPLHVVDQVTKKRLILDCSHLNNFIEIPSFKYEDHKSALCYFKKGGFMIGYDLKDGYNQILIDKRFRKYLSFQFEHEGKTVYARYVCGPFASKIFRMYSQKFFVHLPSTGELVESR